MKADYKEKLRNAHVLSSAGNLSTAAISGRTHKMVFVANTSLKMGPGKIAAQVGERMKKGEGVNVDASRLWNCIQ